MSQNAENTWLKLPTVVSMLAAIGAICLAIGVWKGANDSAWQTQLRLNDQVNGRLDSVETKVANSASEQQAVRSSITDLKEWLIAYVNAKTGPNSRIDTGLLNRDPKPN